MRGLPLSGDPPYGHPQLAEPGPGPTQGGRAADAVQHVQPTGPLRSSEQLGWHHLAGGSGGPQQWKQLLEIYGLTEEQALNYTDNPKDNLEGLAAFKVPLYFSFGLHDALVPMEENSLVLATNYSKLPIK